LTIIAVPSSAPSRHQGDNMAASCGRDAQSCPVVVPSVFRQTLPLSFFCTAVYLAVILVIIGRYISHGLTYYGNSADKLRHTSFVAYSVELVLLNKHQISGGGAYLHCYHHQCYCFVEYAWCCCPFIHGTCNDTAKGTGHCSKGSPVGRVRKITVNCVEQQV